MTQWTTWTDDELTAQIGEWRRHVQEEEARKAEAVARADMDTAIRIGMELGRWETDHMATRPRLRRWNQTRLREQDYIGTHGERPDDDWYRRENREIREQPLRETRYVPLPPEGPRPA